MSDKLKLVYFDIRGRCEYVRLVLKLAGQPYDEVTIKYGSDEWLKEKPKTPYGQLPYIEYKGKVYGQSHAIAEFFARKFGFYGQTDLDALRIGEVIGLWEDQLQILNMYRLAKEGSEEKAEQLKRNLDVECPKFFGILEKLLEDGGSSGYFVNNSISLADLYVYDMQDNLFHLKKDALEGYPLLQKLRHNIESESRLKAYLAQRKSTVY